MKNIKENSYYLYLVLSIIGGTFTFYYAVAGVVSNGGFFNAVEFIKSTWIDNYYAKSITFDFWTGAIAGTLFILIEGLRLEMKYIWLYLLLTFFIGFAFGFPLFLFIRQQYMKLRRKS